MAKILPSLISAYRPISSISYLFVIYPHCYPLLPLFSMLFYYLIFSSVIKQCLKSSFVGFKTSDTFAWQKLVPLAVYQSLPSFFLNFLRLFLISVSDTLNFIFFTVPTFSLPSCILSPPLPPSLPHHRDVHVPSCTSPFSLFYHSFICLLL